MGIVLPLIMFVAFLGLNATSSYYERQLNKAPPAAVAMASAQTFLSYRNAVANFMSANHGFTGTISLQSLAQYMPGVNLATLSGMSNNVTATPGAGVTVIVAAQGLAPGAATSALSQSQNDASIGMTRGGQWTSYFAPSVPIAAPGAVDSNLTYMYTIN